MRLLIAENPFRVSAFDGEQRVNLFRIERIGLFGRATLESDRFDLAEVRLEVFLIGDEIHELVSGFDITEVFGLNDERTALGRITFSCLGCVCRPACARA